MRTCGERFLLTVAAAVLLVSPAAAARGAAIDSGPSSGTAVPAQYKNCTALNKKYPHGLGKANAKDKTSGRPVTTFKRNTKLYNTAMSHNKRLDGDKDGVACEKA